MKDPILLILFCAYLFSCSDKSNLENDLFVSEEERKIMNMCDSNSLDSVEEIKNNLIGTWEIMGYGCGFCAPHDAPFSHIEFSATSGKLIYERETEETELDFIWNVVLTTSPGAPGLLLTTDPPHHSLVVDHFCADYMYFDHTSFDGAMYIYQKQ